MSDPIQATACVPTVHAEIGRLEAMAHQFDVAYLGRKLRWRRWGNGPALVLVHGGHGNWMDWVRNIEAMLRQHAVWVPDLPGFGESDELAGDPHAPNRQQHLLDAVSATLETLVGSAHQSTWRASRTVAWSPPSWPRSAATFAGWRCWAAPVTAARTASAPKW